MVRDMTEKGGGGRHVYSKERSGLTTQQGMVREGVLGFHYWYGRRSISVMYCSAESRGMAYPMA
jgi:hypothetical protein